MDMSSLVGLRGMLNRFKTSHPKFFAFLERAGKETDAGSLIELRLTTSDGRVMETNMRVKEEDMELINALMK